MVKKRYIFFVLVVLIIGVLGIGIFAYIQISKASDLKFPGFRILGWQGTWMHGLSVLFVRKSANPPETPPTPAADPLQNPETPASDDYEVIYTATEVGTPVGDRVTKDIGPDGGTLASPDGRLTLTVPKNALTETVAFGIQPITNKFGVGLGLAYRLEPDTKTFTTPLEISIHYDEHDLEGTFPEAFSLAYQDDKGAWHMQKQIDLDKEKKTIAVSTTHFSIWSATTTLKLTPSKATVLVGESVSLSLTDCNESLIGGALDKFIDLSDRLISGHDHPCLPANWHKGWKLQGEGKLTSDTFTMIYTAPAKKPKPNVATVVVYRPEFMVSVERPCTSSDGHIAGKNDEKWIMPKKCYYRVPGPESVEAVITIIDKGYKVSGNAGGDTVFSGVICDPETSFTLKNTNPFLSPFKFAPSSSSAGTWTFSTMGGVRGGGKGKYTLDGPDSAKTALVLTGDSTGCVAGHCLFGGGEVRLKLTPLEPNEGGCGE